MNTSMLCYIPGVQHDLNLAGTTSFAYSVARKKIVDSAQAECRDPCSLGSPSQKEQRSEGPFRYDNWHKPQGTVEHTTFVKVQP